jgi:cytochrome P450
MPDTTHPTAPPAQRTAALPVRVTLAGAPMSMLQSLAAARCNVLSIIPEIATRDPIVSGRTGTRWHMITEPETIRRVVLEAVDAYPKSTVTKTLLRPAIGESLFIAEGAHWRWQRRAAAPAFTHRNIQALTPVMTQAAARCADRVAAAGPRAVNLLDEMIETTFDVISDVTFSGDEGFDRRAVHDAVETYVAGAGKISLFDVLNFPDWIPRPERAFNRATTEAMHAVADKAIDDRITRGAPDGVPDLLDLLMAGEDPETGRKMNADELRDNLLTFIVAGHETTAVTLAWSFYLCAFDAAVQARARDEIRARCPDGQVRGEDVAHLPFVRAIVEEALRLYPPAGMVSRTALKPDTLCGREVRAGDTVMIPIYALHRHHGLWSEPDAFRPERWLSGEKPPRYAYLPFGDGPRICIGASFAMTEAIVILATLLARFRFRAVPGKVPDPVMILTLRPEGGVWLEAEPVEASPAP